MDAIELPDNRPESGEENNQAPSIHRIGAGFTGTESRFPGDTSGLDVGRYWWRIIAFGPYGFHSVFSDAWCFDVTEQRPRPDLLAPPNGSSYGWQPITFDWTDVPGATAYAIELLSAPPENPNGTTPSIYRLTAAIAGTESSYQGNTTGLDGTYWWRIIALGPSGFKGVFSDAYSFNVNLPAIFMPSLVSPHNGQSFGWGPVTFDWTDVPGATAYAIELCSDPPLPWEEHTKSPSTNRITAGIAGTESWYQGDTSSLSDGTYYWRIIAIKDGELYGVFSDTWSFNVTSPVTWHEIAVYSSYDNYSSPYFYVPSDIWRIHFVIIDPEYFPYLGFILGDAYSYWFDSGDFYSEGVWTYDYYGAGTYYLDLYIANCYAGAVVEAYY